MAWKFLVTGGGTVLALLVSSSFALGQDSSFKLLVAQPSSGTTKTLELTPDNDAEDLEVGYRHHGYYHHRGGYGYYRPYAGFYYRPYSYYSYYYRPYYYPSLYFSIGRPYYPSYYAPYYTPYYSYPAPYYYYYPVGLNVTIGSASVRAVLPGAANGVYNLPMPTPSPGQPGTFPYDGGPANPIPPAKPEAKPAPSTLPLEGRTISVQAPSAPKYTYPAYGEDLNRANGNPDRTILIRK